MGGVCGCPKRIFLERIVRFHEGALVYDLRKLNVDPNTVGNDELYLLATYMLKDPASWLHAEIAEWEFPVSPEWAMLAEIYDIHMAISTKEKPTYPRPWVKPVVVETRPDAREILQRAKDGDLEWQNKPTPM